MPDDRALGIERRPAKGDPEVELVVVHQHADVAEFWLDDGEVLIFDAAELRHALAENEAA